VIATAVGIFSTIRGSTRSRYSLTQSWRGMLCRPCFHMACSKFVLSTICAARCVSATVYCICNNSFYVRQHVLLSRTSYCNSVCPSVCPGVCDVLVPNQAQVRETPGLHCMIV